MMRDPLAAVGQVAREWARQSNPWTNVYGLSRTILAAATAATLAFTRPATLFPEQDLTAAAYDGPARIGLFCLLSPHLEAARWIGVALLLLTTSGWRPRFTGVLHWWVSFSFQAAAVTLDGGDQVAAVLTLLLVPVTLTDGRVWHWQVSQGGTERQRLIALSALTMVRVQVAAIYLVAAVTKLRVEEWSDGTAFYYYFHHPSDGASPWVAPWLGPLLSYAPAVSVITWGTLMLEFFLFASLVMEKRRRKYLLPAALAFHAGIAMVLGIVSFAMAMAAALILLLRPVEQPFSFGRRSNIDARTHTRLTRTLWRPGRFRNSSNTYRELSGRPAGYFPTRDTADGIGGANIR